METKYYYLEVIAYKGNEIVRRFDITQKSKPEIEKLENGLNSRMNHTEYYTFMKKSDIKLATIN